MALFCRVGTQWRVGASGATGLDYCAVYPLMDRMDLPEQEWDFLLLDLQTMEGAALAEMNTKE